ncbi:ribosomal protein S18-alanine N-acetyltransferase [Acetobacter sp.]|jgi:ribosomal-protein-alanine N-acetyltransferase|uniref:ribosomal protein S18-alanine N-acetyltransferase n=1 Tax=Acetobacter sp. TaxID=440 RepID=UPI0025BD52E0|nr:ribosomal protein S18-alanine N-acetyltransferase [Acetobacter sp.]MCH4092482.1 ribosomal protein S18-alanine N-acetyltransferase [Acetobacter sp.]MCI1299616.1 ribosomal protein S18-alanine N-acetyltransferase [Acetobacter sp.]MCI1315504.1 ribosomal protein S18-alanine N-acetyltransferase [Acetobacter sp.]
MHFSAVLADLHASAFEGGACWPESAFAELFTTPGTQAFVASEQGEPIGFVLIRIVLDEAEILTLAVAPERRRRGVARKLLETVEQGLEKKQITKLFLEVSTKNISAEALYTTAGFRAAGIRKRYYEDGSDAIVMVRDIARSP